MSQRPQDNNTPATSSVDGSTITADSRQPTPLQRPGPSRELPPPHARPSRSASFSNLLNPEDGAQRRRKVPELDSPLSASSALPPFKHGRQSPAIPGPSGTPIEQRRILTPRSPSLHRAASMGQLGNPTGNLDAQQSPFLNSRTYTAEPGAAGVPPLPIPRGFVPHSPSTAGRPPSISTLDAKARSPSVSPRTSYAQHYGSLRSSPASSTLPSLSAGPYTADLMPGRQRPLSIPISSAAGQNVYQMMTLQTSSGTVQVPVDVQAASRVADEKRRRNAGASARFRARRKEKEKESSSTIAKLEMQLKYLHEDVEFYRRERGYLAGIVLQVPGGDRHFPRPQSPRHRRVSIPRSIDSGEYLSGPESSPHPGDERNVRRRTSTLSMVPPSGPHYPYEHQQYHAPQSLPGPSSLLPPIHAHSGSATAPMPAHAAWNPYNSEQRDRHAR